MNQTIKILWDEAQALVHHMHGDKKATAKFYAYTDALKQLQRLEKAEEEIPKAMRNDTPYKSRRNR